MGKFKNYGWLIGLVSVTLFSCLGGDEYKTDEWNLKNAQIAAFGLSNDSIPRLDSVIFTIDQINGKIFNPDSMPYGTVIDRKVIVKLNYEVTATAVQIFPQATGDTINWNGSDSIDFSQPVIFKVYAADGVTTKTYEAKLNVHQVDPDSMVWTKFVTIGAGRVFSEMKIVERKWLAYCLYARENGVVKLFRSGLISTLPESEVALTGFPNNAVLSSVTEYGSSLFVMDSVGNIYSSESGIGVYWGPSEGMDIKALLGTLPANSIFGINSMLCGIQNVNGTLKFCTYDSDNGWTVGNDVPADFPISGFGSVTYDIMYYPHLIVASGRNQSEFLTHTAWSTMNGLTWVPLTNEQMPFADSEGASIVRYDDKLFMIGGFDIDGNIIDKTYFSRDNGVTWRQDTVFFPADFTARGFATVLVEDNNYMYLFGGKDTKNGNSVNDVWRGRINRLGFNRNED